MQVHTNSLDLSSVVSSVKKGRPNAVRVHKSNKQLKDKQRDAILVEVSKNMVKADPEEFASLFDKFKHITL